MTPTIHATRVGLTSGVALCRTCTTKEWDYSSTFARKRAMKLVRQHVAETGHVVDFEDSYQTTIERATS